MNPKQNLRRNLRGYFRTPAQKTTPAFNDYFKAKFFDLSYEKNFNECEAGVLTTELAAPGESYSSLKREQVTNTSLSRFPPKKKNTRFFGIFSKAKCFFIKNIRIHKH